MRPIDADVLKQHIDKLPALPDGNFAGNHSALKALINMQPTIQTVATDTNVGNNSEIPNSSDAISRQAAVDAAKDWYEGLICGSVNGLIKRLNALPTAQPEPKEGHWIDKGWDGDWAWQIDGRGNCWRVIECSECGKRVLVESNYCPHCGDKKKGAEHEAD